MIQKQHKPASLWRRVAALFYDGLICLALLMLVCAIIVAFNHGASIPSGNSYLQTLLLFIIFLYYACSIRFGGQTIGMRPWHLYILRQDGHSLTLKNICIRFLLAIPFATVGLLSIPLNQKKLALHDWLSNTCVVQSECTQHQTTQTSK